jgi:hypothetical protein
MCQPISFVSDGKGGYRFFGFEERQKIAAGGVVDKSGNAIDVDQADSHSSIAAFFNWDDDRCNKYEYDYVSDSAKLDGDVVAGDDREAAQKFARETLRPMVKKLVAEACDDAVFGVLPHVLGEISTKKYAVFAARQVLDLFEKEYPGDNRPRAAIEAAEKYIAEPTEANKNAAYAAYAAATAAYAAYAAATAAYAAYAAAYDARAAAAAYAAYYASCANPACRSAIVAYGRKLFAEENR